MPGTWKQHEAPSATERQTRGICVLLRHRATFTCLVAECLIRAIESPCASSEVVNHLASTGVVCSKATPVLDNATVQIKGSKNIQRLQRWTNCDSPSGVLVVAKLGATRRNQQMSSVCNRAWTREQIPIDAPKAAPTPAPRATLFRHLLSSTLILDASLPTRLKEESPDVSEAGPDQSFDYGRWLCALQHCSLAVY